MSKRKVIIEIDLNDDRINSIEDLEQEILSQEIYGQVARKYLDSLQDDMAQYVNTRKGSKNVHIKTHQKKQFRTDMGIANQIKLSSMKRAGIFEGIKPTILEIFSLFKPFAIS